MHFAAPDGTFHTRKCLVVSEEEVVSHSQDNHTEDQPAASLHTLTAIQTPHLRDVLFDGDAGTRSSGARCGGRDNHRGRGDGCSNVLGRGRSDFLELCGGRGNRSNDSAQRGDDHTIDLSGEDSGSEFDGLYSHALKLKRRIILSRGGRSKGRTMRRKAGQSGDVDRGGHDVEDRLRDCSSSGGMGDVLGAD